jgi:Uma2 family endonuclease
MVGALRENAPILSVNSFRKWLRSRPDEEHWELIEGVPMMMAPPTRRHQRIVSNLESLLNDALKRYNPQYAAYQNIGVNIVSTVPYDPEPDVAVIREDESSDPRYADRFYLVAEVLSESDKDIIESKRDIYRAQPSCTCILLVNQDKAEITVERRTNEGWRSQLLRGPDELLLPEFGLNCPVKDIYRDTPLDEQGS